MGLALAVGWSGYLLVYFGVCSVKGPGVGLLDLIVPGRTVVIPTSASAQGPAGGGPGAGGSTPPGGSLIPGQDPGGPGVTPGPGDNQPQPGGVFT